MYNRKKRKKEMQKILEETIDKLTCIAKKYNIVQHAAVEARKEAEKLKEALKNFKIDEKKRGEKNGI